MNAKVHILSGAAFALLAFPYATHADIDRSLLGCAPFPWAIAGNSECPWIDIGRATEAEEFWRVKAE